jgi:hypothetical protein
MEFEAPAPPEKTAASRPSARPPVDPAGYARARYREGDFAEVASTVDAMDASARTVEILYLRARSAEKLGRRREAASGYEAVFKADPDGFWGGQAKWMLALDKKLAGSRDSRLAKNAASSRPEDGGKP